MRTCDTTIFKRTQAAKFATKFFSIPEHIVSQHFNSYFLLYWEGSHIIRLIKEGKIESPSITKGTIEYQVIYHTVTRGEILANPEKQYALSFRITKDNRAYVMIGRSGK